ncbi:Ig-like domain-containing protein [Collinsella sp. LCP21S3_A3]|uniref:Ig-like domain-containing protein n=1 Tax=Collinsella sp. LCP21S3_A3 TaxID=3438769 RepID=UPI003F924AFB
MRKQSWVEEGGASRGNGSFVRHAKVFGIKTMATVMTASMILSGVPVQAIAEGIQTDDTFVESNVESSQGDTAATANDASSGQASDQGTTENNSAVQDDAADSGQNTQTSQAVSQDKATTADIALALNNASITYQGQVIAQPSQKVTAPASVDFKFSVTADNGFKLNEAKLTVDGVETKLKADANGEYTVPAAEVAKSPKVTLETEQEKQAETTEAATPIEQNATDTNAVAVQAATDADYTVEVGDSITLKATGASNSGWWSFSDWSIISQTTSGNKAELATRGVGRVTATYTYQDSRWQNQTKTFVVDIIDRKDATTPGIEGPSSVVVDSEFELTETKNASEWEWHLIGDGDYTAARIDSGAGTKKIKLTALYQFAGDGKVVTVQCKYKVPGTNNTVYSDTFNVTIRKRQWKVADWTYVDGTYKAIPTIVDAETNEPVKEWQTGFQVTYYINGEDKGCNPWSGDFSDPNKTYEVKIAPFGDQGWNSKYSGEAKTFDDPVPVKDRTPIASDSPSDVDYDGQEHKWAPTVTDKNTKETLDDTEYDVIYKRDGKETGDFTSPGRITVEIKGKHHHEGEIKKTYRIREKQIKLSVSGPDTVEQFNTIQLTPTLEPAQKGGTYTWTSNNENILTVDKNGKVTGVSEGKATVTVMWTSADGKTVLTADHDVTVTHTTSGETDAMFFYLNDPSGQLDSINTGNWQKLGKGKINLTGYNNSNFPKDNGATKKYDAQARVTKWPGGSTSSKLDVKRGSNDWNKIVKMYQSVIKSQLPNVEVKDSDIESIELLPYKLTRNDDGYHVDCQVVVKCKGLYTVKYWVDDPTASGEGYQQVAVTTTAREGDSTNISDFNQSYPETKTVNGVEYTFSGWFLDAALTKSASLPYVVRNSNLNFYAKYVAGRMVMYDLQGGSWKSGAGTTYKVNAGKTHTVLTEPKREGYEFEGWKVSGLGDQISVNSGDMFTMPDNNVTITAQWKKKSATVTVNYLWGDKDSHELIESDKLAGDYSFDDVIDVADVAKDFGGYTIKPSKSTKRVLDAGENVINIYYYKNVTLTAKSASKTYNGEQQALEGYTTSEGAAKFDDITAKGSGTNAGEYKVAFNEGAQGAVSKDAKYIVSETVSGKLTITPVTDKVTITVKGHKGGKKYNGEEQTVEGYDIDASTSPAGVVKSDVKYSGTASVSKTDAGKYAMGLKDTQFSLSGDAAKNYTNVKFEVVDGELNIARKDVTLKSDDLSKGYDGTALTNNGAALKTEEGFVKGEGATYAFSGSQTTVGSSANAFTYALNSNTKAENYNITKTEGKLEVTDRSQKYEITVTANSDTQTYTGTEHSVSGLSGTTFTNDKGVTYIVEGLSASVSGTDAGEYTNKVSGNAVVKDAQGNDVTSQFNVKTVDGKLTINKREVTIKPKDVSKVYDGNALVAKDWVVAEGSFVDGQSIANPKYTGFQTAPGTSESGISEWGYKDGTNSNNYDIKSAPGTLNVTSRGATQTITVEANSADASYDGNEHSAKGLKTNEFEVDGKKYTVSGLETSSPAKTDVGTYANNITGTAKVTDAQGNDVTSEFEVKTKNGTLTIAKADVTIAPKDASKPYDGQPLTATDFTATGFIGDDTVANVVYGGSQTEAGTSASSITSYEAAKGTNLDNYNITKGSGALEVTASQKAVVVQVKGNIDTEKYDGTEKNASGFTVTDVTVDGQESTLYGAVAGTDFTFNGTATAARTDAGTTYMGLTADQFANVNKNFSNVTFEVVKDGSMTVTPREVTLTSANDEKPYDGTALTNSNVTVSGDGFAPGQGFTAHVTGSQTNAGSSDNTFTYELTEGTNADNYQITTSNGTLTVKPISDPITVTIVGKTATGTYNGKEYKAEGYTFNSTNDLFTKDKVTFSGTAEAARTDAGKTVMGLTAAQFTNDDATNFTNVTFVVTDGYVDISKAEVTLKSDNLTKSYDGTALVNGETALATESGFAEGEGATYKFTGSQIVVGSSSNAFSYTLNDNTKVDNYNITTIPGTLTVTNRDAKYQITVKANSGKATYDGKQHSATGIESTEFTVDGNKYTVSGLTTEDPTQTNAGTYSNNITGTAVVKDAKGNDVSSEFEVTTENGSLVINKATVTMKSASDKWTYDGNEHTKQEMERVTGFAEGEGATFTYTGAITNVGEAKNTYTYTLNANTSVDNYIFSEPEYGTLTVNPVTDKVTVTIKGKQDTKTYNGSTQFVTGYDFSADNGLYAQSNLKFTGDATAKGIAVGSYNMNLAKEQFSNTNENFSNVEFVVEDGWLKIEGGEIDQGGVVWDTHDNQKVYDGTPLAACAVTATDKHGNALNVEYSIDGKTWTSDPSQITITHFGYQAVQLRATGSNYAEGQYATSFEGIAITKRLVTLTSEGGNKPYDGTPLTNGTVTATAKGEGVGFIDGEGVSFNVTGSQTEKGESDNTFDYTFNEGTSEADYWVTTKCGKLIVTADENEVVVTIAENSGNVEYDGTEKSVSGYEFSASNELYKKSDFTFSGNDTVKGTNVGTYDMELKPSDFSNNNQNFSKVTFEVVDGQLNITPKDIKTGVNMTVEAPANVTYNGQPQQEEPVVKDGDKTLAKNVDYTLSYSKDATNVGTVTVTVTGKGNYSGSADVKYQILKRSVVLESATDSKPYDGTALTRPNVTVEGDGFVDGEVTNVRATGSVTTVAEGEVTNTIDYDTNANFKKGNYSITKKEGKLSITSLSAEDGLTIKPKNAEYTYDADSHTAGKASASASVNGIKVNLEYRVKGSADSEWRADPSQITAINAGTLTVEVRASADNYSGYQYAEQTLTINKRDVELTSASASKVYDGTALTKDWVDMGANRKGTGFIGTDLAGDGQVHATGSQTEVGSSDNTISYQLKKGKENNYNIMDNKLGTLEVTAQSIVPDPENPDSYKGNTISDPSDHVYDGKAHKWTPTVRDAEGNELTEGTDYTVSYDTDDFTNAKTIKVTIAGAGNYTGTVTKKYKITPAPLTVNAKSGSKVYDGTPLIAGGTIEGLVDGETATAQTEGSQTEVGSSDNKVAGIEWGTADEGNYRVVTKNDGTLTVIAKSIVPDPGDENNKMTVGTLGDLVYNGKGQEQKPEVRDGEKALAEGTDYTVSFSEDTKNVGTVTVTVTGKGNYAGTVERTYRITPATLTVNTPSDSKVYDGKALRAEGSITGFVNGEAADFRTTGSQTKVGSSTNTYSIDWAAKESTAKKSNYTVSENLGTLTVTETADEIVATPGSYKGVYDGQAHGVDVTVTGLPEGYSVKAATSSATVTDVNEGKPVAAKVDDLVIVNAQGEDVTNNLKITKGKGSIEITPATLTVTTPSASKAYDGTALTAEGKVSGFVNGETAAFTTTGSQTKVGKSSNGYTLDWNDTAKKSNYKVEESLGTLKVTKNMTAVMVIPQGGTKTYDGEALKSAGVTTYGLPSGYTLEAKTKGSVTNVGSAIAEVGTYSIKDAKGDDVTDQFGNVFTGKAALEVTKRPVTVTSATANKTYDGTALTKHEATVTAGSLVKGESFTYDFTGEQTTVGSTSNAYTVNAGKGTSLDNYKITKNDGTLTVTAKSIIPNPDDEDNIMSVDAPEDVKYDGQAHKWTPTVKDGDKTLAEGTDYTVAYSKDDFTNVTGIITVTITGTGNYAGTVERTYEITKRSVKLTGVKNDSKVYDGTPLEAKDVTVSGDGFVEGEVSGIKAIGSVTNVTAAPVDNPITFTKGDGFKASNYSIATDPGTLEITTRSIDDADYGMSVDSPKDVEYDGHAHKWTPIVKDGDKMLVEGVDYTVTYDKDDFINVTGTITVTITGTGNYSGTVTRTYQVTPAKLTVETEGASKVYDGESLTHDAATIKGLKNGETAAVHATGTQTEVGESDNGYELTWDGSADEGNYTIAGATLGKLVVTESADEIVVSPKNVETTYDGNAHGTTVQVTGLPKGYTVKKAESKATGTNVADGEVKATVDELVIVNAQGKDVTSKLNIKRGTATIKINPAPLTVTTDGGEKEYDGTALTANGIKVEGLKGKDSVSAKTTGSRTKVGSSNNTYEINWKDTKKSNYKVTDVLGTLKVTPSTKAVTLTSGSASHAYSGHALTSDEIKAEGLPEGFTVKAKMDGTQTDAGSSENTVKSYKILDAKGDDVTDMFGNVTVKTGTLTVSPKKITVETGGATKVYDGEELTNKNGAIHGLVSGEHADVVTNGTQTNVGSSDNGYTIAWGAAKEGNYTIASDTLGKLIVTPQSVNPNDPSYHKLQVSNPADLTYDGQTHKWAPEVKDYTGTELKEGVDYTLTYDTDDFINAGSITVTVVGKGNYTGTVSRTYRIKPAPVFIKTESAARVYNGKALTAGGAITGLVNGETVDFRVTGSQTKVGHSANTYKLAWTGTAREANYTVDSIETGTLTVTESEDTVVVTTTGGIFTYDGNAHGATVAVSQLPEGYTVDGTPSSDATATDANGEGVKATVDHLVIRNAEGEDVTSKLNIKKIDGTIKVLPAELTVTTDSATKVYDGTALTAGAAELDLMGDEEATLEAIGKQTQVGSSSNGYKLTFDKTAKAKNYKVVSENLGTLTVTKQSIVPSEPGTPSDNYKGVTVDDPKDAVYDGVEHKWTPVVKDAEGKTLVEGADYMVSYDTDDFIDVATINVTITGKGNYAGTIAKSYRITKAPLHVVTGSATKVYDGQALTSATVTIDGLAKRDRIGIAVTGKQTNVGSSQNTYTIDWMQTSADNYELTDELGTLTVAAAPARPTTPTTPTTPSTPANPTTPSTPAVPNLTPNSSDSGSTTTTTAPKGDDSSASNDREQKEEKIFDAKNPLGKFDGKKDTCWVHWYMIICAVATAAYGLFVGLRRDKHGRRLQNDLDKVLGNDDETQE